MKKVITFVLIALVFSSCRTNQLYINLLSPSQVTLSNEVKTVGIVNRSIPEDKKFNAVHQGVSFSNQDLVRDGGIASIQGLKDALVENGRFEAVAFLDSVKLTTPGGGMFPAQLSWDKVDEICKKYRVHALFSLEVFDVQTKITPGTIPVNVSDPMQVINAAKQTTFTTIVKTGWRIYDPRIKQVLDEFPLSNEMSFQVAADPTTAVEGITGRKEYVKQTGNKAGHIYADRIIQHRFRAYRDYFIRGGNYDFKVAKRRARSGNWNGAGELWQKNTSSPRRKTAGRACYNMAIINEINGNVDEAIKWAQKSYEDYGIRLALKYLPVLRQRKAQDRLVEIQNTK